MKTRPAGIGSARADWMGSLSPKLTAMPLKYLAVPGSHDSFTFWVDVKAPVGPDQKAFVKYLATIFRHMAKKVMVKWSMTQNLTFREQLHAGIRYFDLRVSSKPREPGKEIYFIHGLFGHKVRDGLSDINLFLNKHRKEVVFLDFNHHYAMEEEHHVYLISMLQEVFGSKLCRASPVETITLDFLWEKKYQCSTTTLQHRAVLSFGPATRSRHPGPTPPNHTNSSSSWRPRCRSGSSRAPSTCPRPSSPQRSTPWPKAWCGAYATTWWRETFLPS
ncbi:PI-PLC X domain-containing protein 2 isoform X2 [Gadus chalcogrammus]|uniref:PI-PLC X domain-containing protein 2 isoform X2 n=1 Tax=Gadus chalcogrammus TaxID=1042646 RepID=UPI0024C4B02D|nr:PI-PLC X domain-containing protein 2 isoform X2 [Gadus chalcogrammus]